MVNRQSRAFRAAVTIEHRALGAAFLVLLMLGVWFTYAVFNKSFTDYDEVTLRASKTGLQLPDRADVKLRGVIVGEVLQSQLVDDGVQLTLGLYPSRRESVPADVTAQIIPKTLFGEKYVALQVPDGVAAAASQPIEAGAEITEAKVGFEIERLLDDIYPFLRTVQPAELNYTLTALANALEGRGEQIGENLSTLDDYLKRTNPQIPALVEDLRLLAKTSDVYRSAVPEVARLLRNSVTTGATLTEKEQKIQALFADVAAFSSTSRGFLEANGDNIVRLSQLGAQQLPLYAKYAPEYPCLFYGIVKAAPRQAESFRDKTLHINLETLPKQPRGYGPQDRPRYGDKRGPLDPEICRRGFVDEEWNQHHLPPQWLVPDFDDGVDEPTGKQRPAPLLGLAPDAAGTAADRAAADDLASLLVGPMGRDTEVRSR